MLKKGTFLLSKEILKPLVDDGLLDKEIAKLLDCCTRTVLMARKRHSLGCPYKRGASKYINRWMVKDFVQRGLNDQEIAKVMEIHYNSVRRIRREGYPILDAYGANKIKVRRKTVFILHDRHRYGYKRISKEVGLSESSVRKMIMARGRSHTPAECNAAFYQSRRKL